MRQRSWVPVALAMSLAPLAGCVPSVMAPTVVVTPGQGKLPADFVADQSACTAQANQQMAPTIQAANNQLVGNALFAVTPAQTAQSVQSAQVTLQQQFNAAYSQCMYAKGENVPGLTPPPSEEAAPEPVHHAKRYAHKKPAVKATNAGFVEPTPAATASSATPAATSGGGSFVEPAPAAAAAPAAATTAAGGGGFAVPAAATH